VSGLNVEAPREGPKKEKKKTNKNIENQIPKSFRQNFKKIPLVPLNQFESFKISFLPLPLALSPSLTFTFNLPLFPHCEDRSPRPLSSVSLGALVTVATSQARTPPSFLSDLIFSPFPPLSKFGS
jgi:hypothetical protein